MNLNNNLEINKDKNESSQKLLIVISLCFILVLGGLISLLIFYSNNSKTDVELYNEAVARAHTQYTEGIDSFYNLDSESEFNAIDYEVVISTDLDTDSKQNPDSLAESIDGFFNICQASTDSEGNLFESLFSTLLEDSSMSELDDDFVSKRGSITMNINTIYQTSTDDLEIANFKSLFDIKGSLNDEELDLLQLQMLGLISDVPPRIYMQYEESCLGTLLLELLGIEGDTWIQIPDEETNNAIEEIKSYAFDQETSSVIFLQTVLHNILSEDGILLLDAPIEDNDLDGVKKYKLEINQEAFNQYQDKIKEIQLESAQELLDDSSVPEFLGFVDSPIVTGDIFRLIHYEGEIDYTEDVEYQAFIDIDSETLIKIRFIYDLDGEAYYKDFILSDAEAGNTKIITIIESSQQDNHGNLIVEQQSSRTSIKLAITSDTPSIEINFNDSSVDLFMKWTLSQISVSDEDFQKPTNIIDIE